VGAGAGWGSETNSGQDNGGVKTKAVESDVESEPRPGGAEQNLSILPLAEVVTEVGPGGLGDVDLVGNDAVIGAGLDALPVSIDILDGLPHVTFNIEGETRGLGNGETVVEGDTSGNATETDEETPTVVNSRGLGGRPGQNGILVGCDDDEGDEAGAWWNLRSMSG
jgi:hypothetical protein